MGRSPKVRCCAQRTIAARDRRSETAATATALARSRRGRDARCRGTANSADAPPLLSPEQMNASEIQLALQKLNVLGRVLYIAAHPDDENTNLMAFWANGSLYDAAYLSVTRGDGGQNMTGTRTGRAARRYSNRGIGRCATHRPRQAILHASARFRVFEDS